MIMKVTIQSSNVLYSLLLIYLIKKKISKGKSNNQTEQNLQLTMNYRY